MKYISLHLNNNSNSYYYETTMLKINNFRTAHHQINKINFIYPRIINIMGSQMLNKKMRWVSLLGLICLLVLFRVWPSQTFIAFFLGMLISPPIFVFASVLKEGIPTILKELKSVFVTGKEILLISISKKSITLEPEFR